jgi:hypothetical protein
MYRCATISPAELDALRQIENVVRQGRVLHVGADKITLEHGSLATGPGHVSVDCSASGLRLSPARPIFESDRVTLQQVRTCQPTFNAALIAWVEARRDDNAERNRLCPPNPYPSASVDWLRGMAIQQRATTAWFEQSDLAAWLDTARLNAARAMTHYMKVPQMQAALARMMANSEPAVTNIERLLATTA